MARYPSGLPERYRWHWDHAWKARSRNHPGFRRWLDRHGYLSPHFTKAEAKCKDGTWVPKHLLPAARRHAWNLERMRKDLGHAISILSWYRTPWYNRRIGGARFSKHMEACATDHTRQWVQRVGRRNVQRVAENVFRNGGVGTYPAGSMHFDSRGSRSRWTSF
jgi:hypothetical protein